MFRPRLCLAPALFLLLLLASAAPVCAWPGVVVRVTDGDTVVVAPAGAVDADISVRLYGIDAPELRQPGGKSSKKALQNLLREGDAVEVVGLNTDRYHRSAALIVRDKRSVNYEMLRQGWAWVYPQYCKASFCRKWKQAEKSARTERAGVWTEDTATPPWQWRKEHHQEDNAGAVTEPRPPRQPR